MKGIEIVITPPTAATTKMPGLLGWMCLKVGRFTTAYWAMMIRTSMRGVATQKTDKESGMTTIYALDVGNNREKLNAPAMKSFYALMEKSLGVMILVN